MMCACSCAHDRSLICFLLLLICILTVLISILQKICILLDVAFQKRLITRTQWRCQMNGETAKDDAVCLKCVHYIFEMHQLIPNHSHQTNINADSKLCIASLGKSKYNVHMIGFCLFGLVVCLCCRVSITMWLSSDSHRLRMMLRTKYFHHIEMSFDCVPLRTNWNKRRMTAIVLFIIFNKLMRGRMWWQLKHFCPMWHGFCFLLYTFFASSAGFCSTFESSSDKRWASVFVCAQFSAFISVYVNLELTSVG